jgi:hypothetical protein
MIQKLTTYATINRWKAEDAMKNVRFFSGGRYSYKPSEKYLAAKAKFGLKVKS